MCIDTLAEIYRCVSYIAFVCVNAYMRNGKPWEHLGTSFLRRENPKLRATIVWVVMYDLHTCLNVNNKYYYGSNPLRCLVSLN